MDMDMEDTKAEEKERVEASMAKEMERKEREKDSTTLQYFMEIATFVG